VEAFGRDLVPIDLHTWGNPNPSLADPLMLDDFKMDTQVFFNPVLERLALISAIHPD
jgi:hypothetical protein